MFLKESSELRSSVFAGDGEEEKRDDSLLALLE